MDNGQASNEKLNKGIYISLGIFLVIWAYRLLLKGTMAVFMAKQLFVFFGAMAVLGSLFYSLCIPGAGLYMGYFILKKNIKALGFFIVTVAVEFISNLFILIHYFLNIRSDSGMPAAQESNPVYVEYHSLYPFYGLIILEAAILVYLIANKLNKKSSQTTPQISETA